MFHEESKGFDLAIYILAITCLSPLFQSLVAGYSVKQLLQLNFSPR